MKRIQAWSCCVLFIRTWLTAGVTAKLLCLDIHVYHSFTLALFLQETRDWNTEDNIAFRTPVTKNYKADQFYSTFAKKHWNTYKSRTHFTYFPISTFPHVLTEQGCPFSFGFGNQPLPTLLKITPINEKKADLFSHSPYLFQTIQAYNILLLRMFLRTVWGSWFTSSHV